MTPIGKATLKPEIAHTKNLFEAPARLAGRCLTVLEEAEPSGDLLCFVSCPEREDGGYLVDVDRRDVAFATLQPKEVRDKDRVSLLLDLVSRKVDHA